MFENGLKILLTLDVIAWVIFAYANYRIFNPKITYFQIQWFFDVWKTDFESRFFPLIFVVFIYRTKIKTPYFEYRIRKIQK